MTVPSTERLTELTPTLSEALTWTLIVPDMVAPLAGEEMLTEGGVTSVVVVVGFGLPLLAAEISNDEAEVRKPNLPEMSNGIFATFAGSSGTAPVNCIELETFDFCS
jgi:hypothetical protein